MKRKLDIWIGVLVLSGLLAAGATAQSLGEAARQERAKKGPPPAQVKVYTNDNLPTSGGLSEVGAVSSPAASAAASKAEEKSKSEAKKEDRGKLEAEWRARFKAVKDQIALLEREVALRKGENQTQNVRYLMIYPQMAQQVDKNQQEIKQKEKELADAKQKLEDIKEELRKAGLPSSWAD